jgi:hypothetical protein
MTPEDEEFNRIEREAKQRLEAVKETIRYRDAFPKDYALPKPWVGLTTEEIEAIGKPYEEKDRSIQAWGLFACAIEEKLREKNV